MRLWVNGSLLDDPMTSAISAVDHGLTVGDGAFETIKVADGKPFALTRHLTRLRSSAQGLGLPAPDLDHVREGIDAVLTGWDQPDGRVRITYTGGPSPLGSERYEVEPTTVVGVTELTQRSAATALTTVPWTRNERGALTGLKTTSYAENVMALEYAGQRGGSEALFANTRGEVCEGTGSNVFVVVDGQLLTPPLGSGCLAGVTRALVLEWYGGAEHDLPMSVLSDAEEVFLTSTTRNVQAVSRLDERTFTAPGPVTTSVMDVFAARSIEKVDP